MKQYMMLCLLCVVSGQECQQPKPLFDEVLSQAGQDVDITLVAMFGVHEAGDTWFSCGAIRERGLQNMMAFEYAITRFQSNHPDVFSGINIQGITLDSCSSKPRLQHALFTMEECSTAYNVTSTNTIIGYIGPDRSKETIHITHMIANLNKTVITPSARGMSLLDTSTFPFLLSTVPAANKQVDVMIAILQEMRWTKVQTIHSSDDYGSSGIHVFREAANRAGICIVNSVQLSSVVTQDELEQASQSLLDNAPTRAVVVLAKRHYVKDLLLAFKTVSVGSKTKFSWVGTDSWSNDKSVIDGSADVALGAITVGLAPPTQVLEAQYKDYLSRINITAAQPWIKTFYEEKFQCALSGSSVSSSTCAKNRLEELAIDPYMPYTVAAVEALLMGFEDARSAECPSSSLCDSFLKDPNKWHIINHHVSNLHINGERQFNVKTGQTANIQHVIYNYHHHGYQQVGVYSNGDLSMSSPILAYDEKGEAIDMPTSRCNQSPCTVCGEEANDVTTALPTTSYAGAAVSDASPRQHGVRREGWIIALIVLAGTAIFMLLIFELYLLYKMIGTVFIRQWRTIWLGQLLLLGILLCYLTLFAFVPHQTPATCTIIRFGVGVSYAMCFSVFLVKLMIILSSETLGYLKGIFQALMFLFAWSIQIAVDGEWILLKPGQVRMDNSTGSPVNVCDTSFAEHVQSLIYVIILIFVCVCLAIRTHGIVTNYREGIFIGVAAGFTVPVWFSWILLGFLAEDSRYEEACLAYGLFITATLLLLVMFMPKVRQLVSLGDEGIYGEDDVPDYAGSVIAPSMAQVMTNNNLAYIKAPDTKPVILLDNEALYLRHPGSTVASSVHSMPISPAGLYNMPTQNRLYTRTHHRPATIDRRTQSEYEFGTTRSVRSVHTNGTSHTSGTRRKTKTYLDIGSL